MPAGDGCRRLEPDNPAVTVVGGVDHSAVLPLCVAAVHHGGAGTLAASLGAGIPTFVCSVFADQPFWGARLVDAGVGAHLPFNDLDRARLEKALRLFSPLGCATRQPRSVPVSDPVPTRPAKLRTASSRPSLAPDGSRAPPSGCDSSRGACCPIDSELERVGRAFRGETVAR